MKISINTPCHENWDKMTPNDKGAFCLSCKKNVIDFTKKTLDEVKTFFVELPSSENVCGRFKETQIKEMSMDHFINEFISWKFVQKAAVICFFIFGSALFSTCSNGNPFVKGDVAITQDTLKIKQDTLKREACAIDTNLVKENIVLGEPAIVPDVNDINRQGEITVMGGPQAIIDTVRKK